ncbi:hypothetical protein SS50377_21024 [Spironucleus salmonicida]|uniref:Uncharacterized protein n=1 Tax=Spironucleus salmonicida TaxID=348837 RepID=V6LJ33_9EUKA|nr:hypothetical protein SS50377_21024 [Spironucleus salmonicida]|eukprot:EST43686.1 Hypothetical protein SS50377_16735 [Spironucleus salmonicida]
MQSNELVKSLINAERFLIINVQGPSQSGKTSLISLLLNDQIQTGLYQPIPQVYSKIIRLKDFSIFVQILDNSSLASHVTLSTDVSIQTRCDVDQICSGFQYYSSFAQQWICSKDQIYQLLHFQKELKTDWKKVYKAQKKRFYANNCCTKFISDKYNSIQFLETLFQNKSKIQYQEQVEYSIIKQEVFSIKFGNPQLRIQQQVYNQNSPYIIGYSKIELMDTFKPHDWLQPYQVTFYEEINNNSVLNIAKALSFSANISLIKTNQCTIIKSSNLEDLEYYLFLLPRKIQFQSKINCFHYTILGRTPILSLTQRLGLFSNLEITFKFIVEHNTCLSEFDAYCQAFNRDSIKIVNQVFDNQNNIKYTFISIFGDLMGIRLLQQTHHLSNVLVRIIDFQYTGKILNPLKIESILGLEFVVQRISSEFLSQLKPFVQIQETVSVQQLHLEAKFEFKLRQILAQRRGRIIGKQSSTFEFLMPILEEPGLITQLDRYFANFQLQRVGLDVQIVPTSDESCDNGYKNCQISYRQLSNAILSFFE